MCGVGEGPGKGWSHPDVYLHGHRFGAVLVVLVMTQPAVVDADPDVHPRRRDGPQPRLRAGSRLRPCLPRGQWSHSGTEPPSYTATRSWRAWQRCSPDWPRATCALEPAFTATRHPPAQRAAPADHGRAHSVTDQRLVPPGNEARRPRQGAIVVPATALFTQDCRARPRLCAAPRWSRFDDPGPPPRPRTPAGPGLTRRQGRATGRTRAASTAPACTHREHRVWPARAARDRRVAEWPWTDPPGG
jgi:hypothetical protein